MNTPTLLILAVCGGLVFILLIVLLILKIKYPKETSVEEIVMLKGDLAPVVQQIKDTAQSVNERETTIISPDTDLDNVTLFYSRPNNDMQSIWTCKGCGTYNRIAENYCVVCGTAK